MIFTKRKFLILSLLCIFVIIYTFMHKSLWYAEPFENKKKGLLILYGECFRDGTQNTRTRDTPASIARQQKASESHVSLCDYLKTNYGADMDIIITTHNTTHKKELQEFYSKYNPKIILVDDKTDMDPITRITNNIKNALPQDTEKYDFIILTRNDICFKTFSFIQPDWNKIMFISKHISNCKYYGFYENGDPYVNPTLIYIPTKYFNKNHIYIDHDAWTKYRNTLNPEMDFMTDFSFDSDTYKDKNDYYYMVGREENTVKHNTEPIDRSLIGKTPSEIDKIISKEDRDKCDSFKFDWKNDPKQFTA